MVDDGGLVFIKVSFNVFRVLDRLSCCAGLSWMLACILKCSIS